MHFGYMRISTGEEEEKAVCQQLLTLVDDERFLFSDEDGREQQRKNYVFLCNMLRSGDVLYVDDLSSLGCTPMQIAAEWQRLIHEVGVDVVVLKGALPLNSLRFKELGAVGEEMEQLVLESLRYGAQFSRRKVRSSDVVPAENNFGRPPLQLDWELFHRTAKRWADGEISVQEACAIVGTARSSWYKYVKDHGYVRGNKHTRKKTEEPLEIK